MKQHLNYDIKCTNGLILYSSTKEELINEEITKITTKILQREKIIHEGKGWEAVR